MSKKNVTRRETVVLSGFGAALTLIASNLAIGALPPTSTAKPTAPSVLTTPGASSNIAINRAALCKLGDVSCMMSKPFAKKLAAAQQAELKILISKKVQVDIPDACLIC